MEYTWEFLNPPTNESEVIGKWFACIYNTKRGPNLFVGKALNHFLYNENDHAAGLELSCLQQELGTTDNIIREHTVGEDIGTFAVHNTICGPLKGVFLGGDKWEFPQYAEVRTIFERVRKVNREFLHTAERKLWYNSL